jgi:cell division protein FtsN
MRAAEQSGEPYEPGRGLNPVRHALLAHERTYPLEQMREIEQREREAAERRAGEAQVPRSVYYLQAGVFRDEAKAVDVLTTLVDLGYDGELQTGEQSGQLVYEVRVGPYEELDEAERAFEVLERSEGLSPSILVQPPQEETP